MWRGHVQRGECMRRNVWLFALLVGMSALLSACVPGESSTPVGSSGVALTATAFGSALARGVSSTLTAAPAVAMPTTVALSPVSTPTRVPPTVAPTPMSLIAPSPTVAPANSSAIAAMMRTAPAGTGRIVTVTADASVNMRGMPTTSGDVLGFIPPGEDAAVIEENVMSPDGGTPWLKVTYADVTGYVRSDLVDMPRAGTPRAGSAGATAPSGMGAMTSPAAGAATATRPPVTPTR